MPDFWQYFKQLFSASEESTSSNPFIHELIERSPEELANYDQWKKTLSRHRLLNWLNEQHVQSMVNPADLDQAMDFLNTPSSKGFVIHFQKTRYPRQEITHFFDYLKERIMEMGYKSYVSDTRSYHKNGKVETVQHHYLKPSIYKQIGTGEKINQRYGNISIELMEQNDQIIDLKFRANSYRDHKFQDADSFNELMQAL